MPLDFERQRTWLWCLPGDDQGIEHALDVLWPSAAVDANLKAMVRCELLQKALSLLVVFLCPKGIVRVEFPVLHPVRLPDPVGKMVERLEYCALISFQPFANETPPNHFPAEQSHYQLLVQ